MDRMRLLVLVAAVVLLLSGCSNASSKAASPVFPGARQVDRTPGAAATVVSGGCGSTTAYRGGAPAWLDAAGQGNNPDFLPYVIANPPDAAAFLWADPLRAGQPNDPSNKILWVVGLPRNGTALVITGHPVGARTPSISDSVPADSSPGEIYPSIVDVPKPGCWHLDLSWAGHKAAVELPFK
jgi:hypothetical protein